MSRLCATSVVFVVAAAMGAPAFAQGPDVETVGEPGPDARHPTASVTRVDLDAARDEGADVAAALDEVVGVHTRRTSFGQTAFATVRGSNTRQVLVEYEGLRLTPPFGAGFDLGGITALGFDDVSVWRGAASTYRGGGAVAGALEFRTRHRRAPGTQFTARALTGAHESYAGSLDAAVATRTVSTRLGVAGRASDGDFAFTDAQGTTTRRVNNDHARRGAFGATEVRDGKTWFRAMVLADQGERGTPGLSEFQNRFASARLDDSHSLALVGAGGQDIWRCGGWSFDAALRGGAQLREAEYRNPAPFLGGAAVLNESRATMFGAVAEASAWGPSSLARIATDVRHDVWRSEVDAERTTAGLGSSWEQAFGERTLAVVALRGELDSDGRGAALPALGLEFRPGKPTTLRANIGRTFRTPNLDELYLDTESLRGNPDLTAERAWVSDLGVSWAEQGLHAGLTGFARSVDSEILFLPVTAYLVEAQNIDGTLATGAEIELALRRKPVAVEASYTFTRAVFAETGNPVPLQPEHAAHLRAEVLPNGFPRLWSAANLRGPLALDVFDNASTPAHVFWDAGVSADYDVVRVGVTVRNLLDDDRALDAAQQPMPGRTWWASLTLRWEDE